MDDEPLTLGSLLVELVDLLAKELGIGLPLPTRNVLINDTNVVAKQLIPQDLVHEDLCSWVKRQNLGTPSEPVEVPPGKWEIVSSGAGLEPEDVGQHHVTTNFGDSKASSPIFEIRPV